MLIALILLFAAVFLAVIALTLYLSAARQSPEKILKRRLQTLAVSDETSSPEVFAGELFRKTTSTEQFVFKLPLMNRVTALIEQSGVHISHLHFLSLTGVAAASVFVTIYVVRSSLLLALLSALLTSCVPFLYLGHQKQLRKKLFDEQLPDALTMIARSLRAGHSLSGAIELISQEMPDPTGELCRIAFEQQQLGMRMTDSLASLLNKIESMDLHFFVTIIRINNEAGGNLAEILDKLADTVRSRLQIRRQVKVYTAEGRMSGYVLTALPVAVFIAFYIVKPDYMNVFVTERICRISLGAAFIAQCAGYLMIRKIVNIRI